MEKKDLPGEEEGPILLFHHWDTDGISAAALILREIEAETELFTPTIGNYYIDEKNKEEIKEKKFEATIVVDMALPPESIQFLKRFGPVYIFDHHLQDKHDVTIHHNPVIDGGSPKDWPSASWVVNEYLNNEPTFLAFLGAFGDREEKLKENDSFYPKVKEFLESSGQEFDSFLQAVYYLDSNYKMGDRKAVSQEARFLKDAQSLQDVLDRDDLKENYHKIQDAIEDEVEGEKRALKEDVMYREMESPYNIISTVTRRLAWSNDEKIVIVSNCEYMENDCQMYIRGPIPDSEKIIQYLTGKGHSAGGKSDVVGMVIPQDEKEEILDKILDML